MILSSENVLLYTASFLDFFVVKGPHSRSTHQYEEMWGLLANFFPEFPPEVQRIEQVTGGAEFLGSPIFGSNTFLSFAKQVDKVISCQEHLSNLEEPQVEFHVLRSCLGICKINYLLRTVPLERVQTAFQIWPGFKTLSWDNTTHLCLTSAGNRQSYQFGLEDLVSEKLREHQLLLS